MILSNAMDVVLQYGERRILDGVDLSVETGEQYAVTGRSGSGKTTLLLVMAGLLPPTAGRLTLGITSREIAYVPQVPSLVPELSALDNATLGLRFRGVDPSAAVDQARDALEELGLGGATDALPAELSGGMQQRVAIARAVVLAPRLLLADEPTGALDRAAGERVLTMMRELAARSETALLIATHDVEVAAMFPRHLALSDGRIAA
ncbi:MAG: putative transport system ATP-binding protein [Actinomycetota bacterium]|jgi:ABC-type lipoprotein export system ATPase subunit|nr:putative transport system ATP-binding protein [Actinomycetota bacterium]